MALFLVAGVFGLPRSAAALARDLPCAIALLTSGVRHLRLLDSSLGRQLLPLLESHPDLAKINV